MPALLRRTQRRIRRSVVFHIFPHGEQHRINEARLHRELGTRDGITGNFNLLSTFTSNHRTGALANTVEGVSSDLQVGDGTALLRSACQHEQVVRPGVSNKEPVVLLVGIAVPVRYPLADEDTMFASASVVEEEGVVGLRRPAFDQQLERPLAHHLVVFAQRITHVAVFLPLTDRRASALEDRLSLLELGVRLLTQKLRLGVVVDRWEEEAWDGCVGEEGM